MHPGKPEDSSIDKSRPNRTTPKGQNEYIVLAIAVVVVSLGGILLLSGLLFGNFRSLAPGRAKLHLPPGASHQAFAPPGGIASNATAMLLSLGAHPLPA